MIVFIDRRYASCTLFATWECNHSLRRYGFRMSYDEHALGASDPVNYNNRNDLDVVGPLTEKYPSIMTRLWQQKQRPDAGD
jgi:hypothetical protein